MSIKWRPSQNGIYVVPDVHGAVDLLNHLLRSFLPLRKNKNSQDLLIFLGDYIDRHMDSWKVLRRLQELKQEYEDQVICLKGNHELMLLQALDKITCSNPDEMYGCWMRNGGEQTIQGYLKEQGRPYFDVSAFPRSSLKKLIPEEDVEFMMQMEPYFVLGNYIFVHGGCRPNEPLENQPLGLLTWDRRLYLHTLFDVLEKKEERIDWETTVVTGHNYSGGKPFLHSKMMMLDTGSPDRLLMIELNSMTGYYAFPNQGRLEKANLTYTTSAEARSLYAYHA